MEVRTIRGALVSDSVAQKGGRPLIRAILAVLSILVGGGVQAQPVTYSFSTGVAAPFGAAFSTAGAPITSEHVTTAAGLAALFQGSSVNGTFQYDASIPAFSTNGDGSVVYAGNPNSSFMGFAATVAGGSLPGFSFSDPRGFTLVGNDTQLIPVPPGSLPNPRVDIFQMFADTQLTSGTHNISGFSLNGFNLYNARLFWIESQTTPELIPDLFSSSALPSAPPAMHGRMALDFIIGTDTSRQYSVFYDSLAVAAPIPEPETYALLLAGLALLGFHGGRRRKSAHARVD